jgi:SRSO17 transposase
MRIAQVRGDRPRSGRLTFRPSARLRYRTLGETGQEYHGKATAGVRKQYLDCADKITNGIGTVPLA